MFITEIYAMGQAGAQQAHNGSLTQQLVAFLPFIVIILIFWFLIFRPQQKRQKELRAMLDSLKKGDKVITNAGIYGTVLNIVDNKVILKIADVKGEAVKIEILKNGIAAKVE